MRINIFVKTGKKLGANYIINESDYTNPQIQEHNTILFILENDEIF